MSIVAKQKMNSLLIIGVAIAFQWFFMFTKHDPSLRPIIPFGDDPYDALGSFATIVDILLCLLLLWRAFRPYRGQAPTAVQVRYLRRTQAAVPLSVLVTLAADAVALVRHRQMWVGAISQNKLLASFGWMVIVSGGALWWIRFCSPKGDSERGKNTMMSAGIVAVLFVLILTIYPEGLINHLSTHLVTVLFGDLLLFVPVSVLLGFLFPDPDASLASRTTAPRNSMFLWTAVTLIALLIGVWLFLAELHEGGGTPPPLRLRLLVASVYIGLTTAGVLIALTLLQRPLGLIRVETVQSNR